MNLKTKVTLAVVANFACAIITITVATLLSSNSIMGKMVEESQVTLAKDNATNVESWLQDKLAVIDAGGKNLSKYPDKPREYIINLTKVLNEAGQLRKLYTGFEDGQVIYSDEWVPPADYDPRKRPWYIQAKTQMKASITEPFISASTGKLILSFISPLVSDGKLFGVLGSDVGLDYLTKQVLGVKLGSSGYAFLVDKEGKILVHPNPDYVMKKNLKDVSAGLADFSAKAAGAESGHTNYMLNGVEKMMTYAKVPSTGWYLCVTVDKADVFAPIKKQFITLVLIGGALLIIGSAIFAFFVGRLLKPLGLLYDRVADVAEGDGDLTKRIDVGARKDEIGMLAEKINDFIGNIHSIIVQVSTASTTLTSDSEKLNSTSASISAGAEEVAAQTVTVATASEEMAATSNDIANNCLMAAESAKQAADTTQNGFRIVSNTVEGIRQRGELTRQNTRSISSLVDRSEQIGTIVATIEDIADQTNLLALNAAIEAARAGEQGRGFAVVADEVRALAERTTRATKEISTMIRAIQLETRNAMVSMEEGVKQSDRGIDEAAQIEDALRLILDQVNAVTMQVSQIATAAEEQNATTNGITNNIHQVTEVVHETAKGSYETAQTALHLSNLAGDLHRVVSKFRL